jgi:hypothetical protein
MAMPSESKIKAQGIAVKSFINITNVHVGNFYKTFSTLPNNDGPHGKLYCRYWDAIDETLGAVHQVTHFHVPLLDTPSNYVAEAVSGFNVEKSGNNELRQWGLLSSSGQGTHFGHMIFSSNIAFDYPSFTKEDDPEITENKMDFPATYKIGNIIYPEAPEELHESLLNGQSNYYYPLEGKWRSFNIRYVYNRNIIVERLFGGRWIKNRAIYWLESLENSVDDQLIGFQTSYRGNPIKGFGMLERFVLRGNERILEIG